MRRVEALRDFEAALAGAQARGKSAFGDDRVLIEKYVCAAAPYRGAGVRRCHGNAVHLFERDCSLQRRHQKVIEEAPAPRHERGDARGDGRRGGKGREGRRLCRRRHGRIHRRRVAMGSGRPLLVHGNEHAAAGRASCHGNDHGPRSGRMAVARRGGRDAAQAAGEMRCTGHAIEARFMRKIRARVFCPRSARWSACACRRRRRHARRHWRARRRRGDACITIR